MARQIVDKILNQILTGQTFNLSVIRDCFRYYLEAAFPDLEFRIATYIDVLGQERIVVWIDDSVDIVLPFKYMQVWVEVRDLEFFHFEIPLPGSLYRRYV